MYIYIYMYVSMYCLQSIQLPVSFLSISQSLPVMLTSHYTQIGFTSSEQRHYWEMWQKQDLLCHLLSLEHQLPLFHLGAFFFFLFLTKQIWKAFITMASIQFDVCLQSFLTNEITPKPMILGQRRIYRWAWVCTGPPNWQVAHSVSHRIYTTKWKRTNVLTCILQFAGVTISTRVIECYVRRKWSL